MTEARPTPDQWLERLRRDEEKSRRGKLKVFFGFSAGVGKTYAMLSAARQLRAQGVDAVVGVVETHGRAETQTLLQGLESLPLREFDYRGRRLREFDLDLALRRAPSLILMDELAHSNLSPQHPSPADATRHPKRWQDVEELLGAGIDVFTTVNVQHLESLNDVVGAITGIRVNETVPDKVFDLADEVVLVDITPDELMQRLKEGKVYVPHQAQEALRRFFRKGNLIALRELSLRRTADRVDDQMRSYRSQEAIATVWPTRESLLVGVGPSPGAEKLVRAASRLAGRIGAQWHAVYVETPRLQRLPRDKRDPILRTLRLAEEMGAQTVVLTGQDPAQLLVDYAREHNLSTIVCGRDFGPRLPGRPSVAERMSRLSPDLNILHIAHGSQTQGEAPLGWAGLCSTNLLNRLKAGAQDRLRFRPAWPAYGWALALCGATAALAGRLTPYFDLANIVMLFLLAVVGVSLRLGRGPAALAAIASVGLFDFFFVTPRFSFAVGDVQYLLTFGVMLAVGLIIGQLTAHLHFQGRVAVRRESRLRALYELARDLSAALTPEQVTAISQGVIQRTFGVRAALLLLDAQEQLRPPPHEADPAQALAVGVDMGVARWALDHGQPAGKGTDTLPGSQLLYLPLRTPMRSRGVLAVSLPSTDALGLPEQRRLLDAFCALTATALERVHYMDVAHQAMLKIESERLRNSVLSALSHDLRTPLTALVGLADSLALGAPPLSDNQGEITTSIRELALRISALVDNLLDMARLQSGEARLNLQWHALEEIIGSALRAREQALAGHTVQVALPPNLPLVSCDSVLMESVLCNLLENAAKYTPPGSRITVSAEVAEGVARVVVADNGPGLPPGNEEALFEKFTRGNRESVTPGVGLGLAICRAIIQAHQGRIWAENTPGGGARFILTLPQGHSPSLEDLETETLDPEGGSHD